MKKIYYRHPKIIIGFTLMFVLLGFLGSLSTRLTIISWIFEMVFFAIVGLVWGYLTALIVELIKLMIVKIKNSHSPHKSKIKESEVAIAKNAITTQGNSYKIFPQLNKPMRCSNCNRISLILDRVEFNDGCLCGDCLAKLELKKSVDLDLWAQQTSWKMAERYRKER